MRTSTIWAGAMLGAAAAALGLIGSDALWLVPLGHLVAQGHIPSSIPFATAPTRGWHDVPAGAQLVLWSSYRLLGGLRGLVVVQAAAAAVGFGALAAGLRREAGDGEAIVVCIVVLVGSIPAVVVTGVQVFSLALFSILVLLLESSPGRIWLAVPLIALWGNLHGGVLAGLGLLACYVFFRRPRDLPVLAASVLALFANPALWHTPRYYESVFRTIVARQGKGLWMPLGAAPLDLVLVAAALVLVIAAVARGPRVRLWEAVALLGLAAGTVHTARTGTSFLFLAAYPAARAFPIRAPRPRLVALVAGALAVLSVVLLVKGPQDPGSQRLAGLAARTGQPVLADAVLGQQVAVAGGRVWIDNPVDAFSDDDQLLYVHWLEGKQIGDGALAHAAYVLVQPRSKAGLRAAHDPRLRMVAADAGGVLYRVRAAAAPAAPA
ncbi:MAG: hypothetical protein ACJ768_15745 [Gaiellaceae bacterium]